MVDAVKKQHRLLKKTQPAALPPEVLALAKEGRQDELEAALAELGLPADYCKAPLPGELPDKGEVSINTSEPPGVLQCKYEVLDRDVLVIRGAFPLGAELIEAANAASAWKQGTQVSPNKSTYTSEGRTSQNALVDSRTHRFFGRFEHAIRVTAHEAGAFYRAVNPHVVWSKDEGWEVMRYQESERFDLHVDHVANKSESQRQLSVLIYLNDSFQGGETEFPRQGLLVKPGAGDVVVFPPWPTHPHAARPVTQGTKYAVVGWLFP